MLKGRVSRSSYDAKPWKCPCGVTNKPTKHRFINLPAFQCSGCKKEFTLDFGFCLGDVKADEKSIVGEVRHQGKRPNCVAYAYGKASEITERVVNIKMGIDPDKVIPIDADRLHQRFCDKFPGLPSADCLTPNVGLHRVLHTGLILRSEGAPRERPGERYFAADVSTIERDAFEEICENIAEGVPLIATYLTGKRKGSLPHCTVYKSAGLKKYKRKKAPKKGHAVVLIGAGMKKGKKFFYFMNSWGKRFCARKNKKGDILTGGIGKLKMENLTNSVVKISAPNETGGDRRLQDQQSLNISKLNYILMTARKNQCHPGKIRSMREQDPNGVNEEELVDDGIYESDEGGHLHRNSVIRKFFEWKKSVVKLLPHYPHQSWLAVPPTHTHGTPCSHDPGSLACDASTITDKLVWREKGPRCGHDIRKGTTLLKKWRMRFTLSTLVA